MRTAVRPPAEFVVRWPIEDQTYSVANLKAEAKERYLNAMQHLGLQAEGPMRLKVHYGQFPNLSIRADVSWDGPMPNVHGLEL